MKPKNRELDIRRNPCRKCGARDVVSKITANANNSRFIHVIRRCYNCGEWLGGATYKNKAKEKQNEQR